MIKFGGDTGTDADAGYLQMDAREFKILKRLYSDAVKNKKEMFYFQNQALLTGYAKYLIEYLEQKFA